MNEQPTPAISELHANHELITDAIRRAVREAVLKLARAGKPVSTWEDGKVVWIPPEEILSRFGNEPSA